MKRVVLYSVYVCVLFQAIAMSLYYFANKGLKYYDAAVYKQFDLLFNKSEDPDLLFIGSSRTHYGVNPLILEQLSGKKVLNAGLEGAKINEMEIVLNAFLSKHSNPEKIFLMLDPFSLDMREERIYNKIPLSAYLDNDVLYALLRRSEGWEAFFWKYVPYSIVTSFSDHIRSNCVKGLFGETYLRPGQYTYKGYINLNETYRGEDTPISSQHALNERGMQALLRILETCKTKNIPLYILQGPYLSSYYKKNKLHVIYSELNKRLSSFALVKTQTEPLNYEETINFKDEVHLNETGATRYSKDIYSNFIKNGE